MSKNLAEQYVASGAKFLDAVEYGWANRINISTLEMYDGQRCILGQLFGGYEKGLKALSISNEEASEYGFEDDADDVSYHDLTKAWKQHLTVKVGDYVGKTTGKTIKVADAFRAGGKNYVVYTTESRPNDPIMATLSDFLGSYEPKADKVNWRVGQIVKSTTGAIFMYAGEQMVWKVSGLGSYGSTLYDVKGAEHDYGKLTKVSTASGHDLVGGMNKDTFQ